MTEQLQERLHEAAGARPAPPAPIEQIVTSGRRIRRRRKTVTALGSTLVVLLLVAGGVTMGRHADTGGDGPPGPAVRRIANDLGDAEAYAKHGALSVGPTVYAGNYQIRFKDKVQLLYYTSEGVVVRAGKHASPDEPGAILYTLIRPDGTTSVLPIKDADDRVPATDPDSPDLAYVRPDGHGGWQFVVVDVRTGRVVDQKTFDGKFTWGGWKAPPVSLAGDKVWALLDAGWLEWDRSTGKTRIVPGTADENLEAAHGRYGLVISSGNSDDDSYRQLGWEAHDFATGAVVARHRESHPDRMDEPFYEFSPDGRYATIQGSYVEGKEDQLVTRVLDLSTGKAVRLPQGGQYGWSPDGHALNVDTKRKVLNVCDPVTGKCTSSPLAVGKGGVKLGGRWYGS